ncbi:ribonuclease H-like domain-containing protein [Tanacetum coccineum]
MFADAKSLGEQSNQGTVGGINQVSSTPCALDVACSFFAQPTTSPQLENEDFQQMDGDDLEELDLRWQVAMLTVRVKKFIQRTGRNMDFKEKRHVSLDKSKIECYNCHRKGHFARECRSGRSQGRRPYGDRSNAQTTESSSQALVAQDGLGGYDWSNDFEVEPVNYALMAISSSNSSSSSDSEVQKCSKCLESFKCLQKNYDTEREKHNKAKLEIRGYEIALESLEARILGHEKNELAWGERYEFQNYDLKCREIKINNLNMELEKVVKERDELKLKIEKWEGSSKNLTKILNSQMSTHDKNRLGFGIQMDDLSNKSETDSENSLTVFEVRSSDKESTLSNNRFTKANKYHVVPPLIIGNPLTPNADISFAALDEYAFRNKIIESKTIEINKTIGNTNEATIVKPKSVNETVVSKSKINKDEVIIKDWTSDDEDDVCVVKTVSSVKSNVTQAVRNYDFYKSLEPSFKNVVNTGEGVVKPVWDYGKWVNHQNFSKKLKYPHEKRTFNPSAVLTRACLVNIDRSNVSTAGSISTVRPIRLVYTIRPVSTARPLASKIAQSNSVIRPNHPRLDIVRPKASNSPIKRSYFTQPVYRPKDLKPDVKTFGVKNMTTVGTRAVVSKGKVENVLKKAKWVWRPKMNYQDHVYKYNGSYMLKKFEYGNAVVDSGCSSHMTGNKAYLSDYEDFNGGFVAFGSDPKGVNAGSLQVNSGRLLVNSVDLKLILVRSKLQLADATGIHNLSNAEIYAGLATLRYVIEGDIVPLLPAMLAGAAVDQGEGSAQPAKPHHIGSMKAPLHVVIHQNVLRDMCTQGIDEKSIEKYSYMNQEGEEYRGSGRSFRILMTDPLGFLVRVIHEREVTVFCHSYTKLQGRLIEKKSVLQSWRQLKTLSKVASQGVSKEKSTDKGKRYRRRARSMVKKIDTRLDAEEEINTGREEINTGIEDVSTGSTKVDSSNASKRGQRKDKSKTRADTVYMSFGAMIKDFTREDLIELYRLVMQKYETNRAEDAYDKVFGNDLRRCLIHLSLKMLFGAYHFNKRCIGKYPLSKKLASDAENEASKMEKMNEVCYNKLLR